MTNRDEKPIVIGIVGGIGSGKSFASKAFASKGAALFDADREARRVYDDPNVLARIRERWPGVVDSKGDVVRGELAKIVFENSEQGRRELTALNEILKQPLLRLFEAWLEKNESKLVALDAPLLFESGWDRFADFIVFVDAPQETRRSRCLARGWAPDEFARREARQLSLAFKRAKANFVVLSDDDSNVDAQIDAILALVRRQVDQP